MSILTKISRSYAALTLFSLTLVACSAILAIGAIHIPRSHSSWMTCVLCLPVAGFGVGTTFTLFALESKRRRDQENAIRAIRNDIKMDREEATLERSA